MSPGECKLTAGGAMLHWYFTLVMAALNLKTLIQATELTENTEKETGFPCFAGSPKR
jgi:hypothetical protein